MGAVLIVDIENDADERTVGVQLYHHPHVDPIRYGPPCLEGSNQRTGGQPPQRDGSLALDQTIVHGRSVAVRVSRVARVLQAQHVGIPLAAFTIDQCQCATRLDVQFDETVFQRAPARANGIAFHSRDGRAEREAAESQPWNGRCTKRDARHVHFVLIRIMSRGIESLLRHSAGQYLHWYARAIAAVQREWLIAGRLAWCAGPERSDEHVAPKKRHVGDGDVAARPRRGIPERKRLSRLLVALAGSVGIMT